MTFTPSTVVKLLSNVPLSNTYEHQMDFASQADQTSYFEGKATHSFTNFTYQREDTAIRVNVGYDDIYDCNYLMYQNANYSSKWFYGFITHKEYINPNMTKVYFEQDTWQTWQFDITFLPSFIEREHCQRFDANGKPIVNTVPENLEFGSEYQVIWKDDLTSTSYYYLLTCTTDLTYTLQQGTIPANPVLPKPHKVSGLMSGLSYYIFDDIASIQQLYSILQQNTSYLECFQSWSLLPYDSVDLTKCSSLTYQGVSYYEVNDYDATLIQKSSYTVADKYNGVTLGTSTYPTESKMLMYPYCFVQLTNYAGESMNIQLEHVDADSLDVDTWATMSADARIAYVVRNYNSDDSLDSAIITDNFPELPTASSGYQQYLSRTKTSRRVGLISDAIGGTLGAIGGIATGDPMAIAGGFMEFDKLAHSLAQVQDAKRTPNSILTQAGGSGFLASIGKLGFSIKWKMIRPEYQTILNNFWQAYGYKVHQVKTPNLKTRQSWNFVKTVGAKLTGNVPQNQLDMMKSMFDNGVTLWHTTSVGDYTQTNDEV